MCYYFEKDERFQLHVAITIIQLHSPKCKNYRDLVIQTTLKKAAHFYTK